MPATEIIPGIWVGDAEAAKNSTFLRTNKIIAVVNATNSVPNVFSKKNIHYFRIPIGDPGPNQTIQNKNVRTMALMLPQALEFIYTHHRQGGVLIHCHAGVQRSAAVMVGFLMKYAHNRGARLTLDEAIAVVQARRPVVFYWGNYVNFKDALQVFKSYHL